MGESETDLLGSLDDRLAREAGGFRRLRQKYGIIGATLICLAALIALGWWNWEEIQKRPGVAWISEQVQQYDWPLSAKSVAEKQLAQAEKEAAAGQIDAATKDYDGAVRIYQKNGDLLGQANLMRSFAKFQNEIGNSDNARQAHIAAADLYDQLHMTDQRDLELRGTGTVGFQRGPTIR